MSTRTTAAEAGELRTRSVTGAKWMAVQKWYARAAGLLTTLVLARLLAPADFGLVALATAFVSVASVLTEAGFSPSLVQAKEVSTALASTAFWVSILISLVSVGVVEAIAGPLALVLHQPGIEPLLRVLAILMPITALSSVQVALLNRDLRMKSLTVRQFVSITAGAIAGVVAALLGWGAWALVAQTLVGAAVGVIALWASTSWRPSLVFSVPDARMLVKQGTAVLGTNLVHQIRDRGDEFLIGGILGAQALGYWSVGTRLTKIALDLFYSVISGISFPVLSRVAHEKERFARAVETGITLNLFLILPALAGLTITTPLLIPLLYGNQWSTSIPSAQIYALAAAIGVFQWLDSQIWWARGQFRTEFWLSSGISALHLVTVAVAAPFGLTAIALAVLFRTCVTAPFRLMVLLRRTDLTIRVYRNAPRIVLTVLLMTACVWGVMAVTTGWPVLVAGLTAVAAGAVSYAGLSLLIQPGPTRMLLELASPRLGRFRRRPHDASKEEVAR